MAKEECGEREGRVLERSRTWEEWGSGQLWNRMGRFKRGKGTVGFSRTGMDNQGLIRGRGTVGLGQMGGVGNV